MHQEVAEMKKLENKGILKDKINSKNAKQQFQEFVASSGIQKIQIKKSVE